MLLNRNLPFSKLSVIRYFCINEVFEALYKSEIIDIQGKRISFTDPLYKYWLARYFFQTYRWQLHNLNY